MANVGKAFEAYERNLISGSSPFGRYMHRYMNRRVEAWRFFGQVLIWVGAWHRVGKLVPIGWAIVVAAWTSGLWRKPTN